MDQSYPTFKVALCGDAGVGKTSWIKMLLCSSFETEYNPTIGIDVHTITVRTTTGQVIKFEFLEVVYKGPEYAKIWNHDYLKGLQAGIIMFDVTSRITYMNVPNHYRDMEPLIKANNPNVPDSEGKGMPIIICGNKVDVKERKVKAKSITFHRKKNLQYYDLSAKCSYNLDKPLLWFARKFMKDPDLELSTPENRKKKREVEIDPEVMERYRKEVRAYPLDIPSETEEALAALELHDKKEASTEAEATVDSTSGSKTLDPSDDDPKRGSMSGNKPFESQGQDLDNDNTESNTLETPGTDLESDSTAPSNNRFILCIHCTRMIFIESSRPSSRSAYSLATTTCRTCERNLEKCESTSHVVENQVSAKLVRSTRVYECCNRIAGDDESIVELLLNDKDEEEGPQMVSIFSADDLVDRISTGDRIYSVRTGKDVLLRSEKLTRNDLLLPYVLGGFL